VRLGLLGQAQVQTLLFFQRSRQQKIGRYFIEAGLLSELQIERLAAECHQHNNRVAGASANGGRRASAG